MCLSTGSLPSRRAQELCRATFQRYPADEEKWSRTPDKRWFTREFPPWRTSFSAIIGYEYPAAAFPRLIPGTRHQRAFLQRGDAFGDYDNDADIDALLLNMKDSPSLLRNGGKQQNWIKIKLIGNKVQSHHHGARVRVVT